MNRRFEIDEWKIIEKEFNSKNQLAAESIFSIGNGNFGQRANFEEKYSGESMQGSYIAGIYYPDKTKVGWWKNGYPDYFAKVINSCNWIGIDVFINDVLLDLSKCEISSFYRELDMKSGTLKRNVICKNKNGDLFEIKSIRFCSMDDDSIGALSYSIKPLNFNGKITFVPYLDFDVKNSDSNYDEKFWTEKKKIINDDYACILSQTKKTFFDVAVTMKISLEPKINEYETENIQKKSFVAKKITFNVKKNQAYTIKKYVSIFSSILNDSKSLIEISKSKVEQAFNFGFEKLLINHKNSWSKIWSNADIYIDGDTASLQAIRFNIFHLYQTYTGKNPKLNIGPKGFTGEKYGGATYWDTEAYCLPFFLKTAKSKVAKQLLLYRYNHLSKAIENAKKLGFNDNAALYPMVTMNGEECHNEWEITFEEIHRNGAIAYAIYNYVKHTGDEEYLKDYGIKVLIAISKFWEQRVNWSEKKNKYVILGVTGPNEFENNVNNNWYTNYIAKWCLQFTIDSDSKLNDKSQINEKNKLKWIDIIDNIYLPVIEDSNIFLQDENFLDKELKTTNLIPINERPISQNWSWDRILRSVYIKQADVLQGLYFFEESFNKKTIEDNLNFYEPFTVHESSLSPCIHSILFSKVNNIDKAFEMYLRTSRLDLDDYNKEVNEGLHITSMAGTWLSIIEGFAGLRINRDKITLNPKLPQNWNSYKFKIIYKNERISINVLKNEVIIENNSDSIINFSIFEKSYYVEKKLNVRYNAD